MINKFTSPLSAILAIILAVAGLVFVYVTMAIGVGFFAGLVVASYRIVVGDF